MIRSRSVACLVPLLALALLAPATPAQDAAAADLSARLAEASQLIEEGDYAAGRQVVLDAVEAQGDSRELLMNVHRVKELLKRAAFRASHEVPPAEELIAGDLQSYDRRSGKIKVRYQASDEPVTTEGGENDEETQALRELLSLLGLGTTTGSEDFTWAFGVPMHPIVFDGPYTIEIEGEFPENDDLGGFVMAMPEMVVNAGDEGVYRIYFGYPTIKLGINKPAMIVHYGGGKPEVLDEDKGTPLELGKKYSVQINVSKSKISASANGRSFLKAKKAGKSYGQFGFRGCPNVKELTISGQANTAWVEGLEDRWLHRAWADFDEQYDPLSELPEALAETVGQASEYDRSLLGELPGKPRRIHEEHAERLQEFERKGQLAKILNYVEALNPLTVGTAYRNWLLAQVHAGLGDHDEAIALCDMVAEEHADFVPARLLKANMHFAGEDEQAGLAMLAQAIAETEDPRPHVQLAGYHVTRGDFARAREVMGAALDAGIPAAELESVAFMLTRAEKGPEWPTTHTFQSRNYEVSSNLSEKACAEASKALEQALSMYNRLFGRADRRDGEQQRYKVYLFSGESSYLSYAGDLFGSQPFNTAGLYSPVLKQLLIWNLPDHERMMATVRHEGFHQYLDRMAGETPTWFNEGTAEYIETARLERGKMTPGAPLMNSVYYLADPKTRWADMSELVTMSRSEFYGDTALHYAQSWALIHYLLHSDRDNSQRYEAYLEAVLDGADRFEAAERAFGDVSWSRLTRAVRDHIKELAGDDED